MTRAYLLFASISFIAFGVWSLIWPLHMAARLGVVEVAGPNGAFELSGIYGGVSLAIAVLCGAGAFASDMRRPALWFLATYMGGYCAARVIATVLHGLPTPYFWSFVAFEAIMLIGAIVCLRRNAGA